MIDQCQKPTLQKRVISILSDRKNKKTRKKNKRLYLNYLLIAMGVRIKYVIPISFRARFLIFAHLACVIWPKTNIVYFSIVISYVAQQLGCISWSLRSLRSDLTTLKSVEKCIGLRGS